jgi:hypothetical protein
MFLRWTKRHDKRGSVHLYARLVSGHRVGGNVRQKHIGSLGFNGATLSADQIRNAWRHLDCMLRRFRPSKTEHANIERAFAAVVGERPPPTALQKLIRAALAERQS